MTHQPFTARMTAESCKHALITGGAGFIGSHLARALLDKGLRVTVIDNLSTGRFENIAPLQGRPGFAFAIDDIENQVVLDRLASEADVIYHLAAAVGVQLIVDNPVRTIETNIMGTEAVFQAAARYRVKVVLTSTSEVYGKSERLPFREDDDCVLGPTSRCRWAYAASKMIDEFLALAYWQEKGTPVVVARMFNTVGPGQTGRYGMVVPRFVAQAIEGRPLTVYGDGEQSRCFLHVNDAVRALVALGESEQAVGQVVNVGATRETSILELARRTIAAVGRAGALPPLADPTSEGCSCERFSLDGLTRLDEGRVVLTPFERAYSSGFEDMLRRVPDIARIGELIGWKPELDLDAILDDVIAEQLAARSGGAIG